MVADADANPTSIPNLPLNLTLTLPLPLPLPLPLTCERGGDGRVVAGAGGDEHRGGERAEAPGGVITR